MSALVQVNNYGNLTNQDQALNNLNLKKESFIDFRAYYKSLFFEIIRDTKQVSEELKIQELKINKKIKSGLEKEILHISGMDLIEGKEETIKLLSDEENKKIVNEAGRTTARELSKIVYSLDTLDTSKTEDDYIELLGKILEKRDELVSSYNSYYNNHLELEEFSPSNRMKEIRAKHSVEIEISNNGNLLIDEKTYKYLSEKEEIKTAQNIKQINSSNWNPIGLNKIKQKKLQNFSDYCLDKKVKLSIIKEKNNLKPSDNLKPSERFLLNTLLEYFNNILSIPKSSKNQLENLHKSFKSRFHKKSFYEVSQLSKNKENTNSVELIKILDYIRKENDYLKRFI